MSVDPTETKRKELLDIVKNADLALIEKLLKGVSERKIETPRDTPMPTRGVDVLSNLNKLRDSAGLPAAGAGFGRK
jgi:hypothetical protein